ncbi:glycoside hydrolase family 51 protein [Phanerochaete carnosa HHB-10118-sp]|uniref:non-reducing end alpha-L-arabinofuranosidase n=1 Tax=Phanerochaete carnosa (strain HHB-10118-sp) TaxID=650164 RepID=K5WFY2_PHACS|nr:glycoside hydrolase family 51 protein [Phanerochaete carnosa HHB-10118-sp]EKM57999.1 glycoside hydrolase family 51 protein [Phanerochaete carnosa HHB-10118-sp]
MSPSSVKPSLDVFPTAPIGTVSPYIFSGFLEHLGRCIYGGILPSDPTTFPYTPRRPSLLTEEGFRKDVLEVLRDELSVPMVRWPGGNYVSSYNWKDGIGPKDQRKRRPELAWGGEESNQFGTDEFIAWCRLARIEPYIILNMGTGTLDDALHWIEYCNGTGDTYWASLRRKNNGRDEPHNVKYWGLGNEVWGEWQIGQETAEAYTTKARQWAHAIKLLDPTIKLIGCGETGLNHWDGVVLDGLVDKIDGHSIHLYTNFGQRDRTVYGPDAAEYSIEICKALINKARYARKVAKPITIAFDEYGVWDETVGTPQNGLQQFYTLADALAMASWLNVFVRQADIVEIACVAQSVNVISPLVTSPTGLLRQTVYWPLYLFSRYMREGTSVRVSVESPKFTGETLPAWISDIKGRPSVLDAAAAVHITENGAYSLRIAVVNRSETESIRTPIRVAYQNTHLECADVEVHELWHADVKAKNYWGRENEVSIKTSRARWDREWTFREHSFTLLVLDSKRA